MTGFARAVGQLGERSWVCEVKSVNGRGLEPRCRLPGSYDGLEPAIRTAIAARFKRGSLQLNIQFDRSARQAAPRVDEAILQQLVDTATALRQRLPDVVLSVDGLLGLRGVIEMAEPEELPEEHAVLETAFLATVDEALELLASERSGEGARLETVVRAQLDEILGLTDAASACAAARPEAIAARLREQVAALLQTDVPLSEERLAQEAALLAVKADIREEIDRLRAHIEAARELLDSDGAIGRKLDFLAQEFNREANTLCAKSSDAALTRTGLDLKAVIDQLREQVQNIE